MERLIESGDLTARLLYGYDVLEGLALLDDESVDCIVTSPPYWGLRNYEGNDRQIGSEGSPWEYIETMTEVFRNAKRILKPSGTVWLNIGDSYATRSPNRNNTVGMFKDRNYDIVPAGKRSIPIGLKRKDLIGVPWRVAFALQSDGWWLRNDIIWSKPNPMPSPVTDRCTVAHEYIFLLSKCDSYYFDADAIREPLADKTVSDHRFGNTGKGRGRYGGQASCPSSFAGANPKGANARTVWKLKPNSYHGSHFAVFPEELPERCIKAGTKKGDTVLDIFSGSGTTGKVAMRLGRNYIGIDVNESYLELAERRVSLIHSDVIKDENQLEMF